MKFKTDSRFIHEVGQRRDSNGRPSQEDALYPTAVIPDQCAFIVCDGMGGHAHGEVASQTVCEAMADGCCTGEDFSCSEFETLLSRAYDLLDKRNPGTGKTMGTTLAFLRLHSKGTLIAHIGDSRVYHIRPGKDAASTRILHVTRDHSLVNDLLKSGELTAEQARDFPRKNIITRAMQPLVRPRPKAEIHTTDDVRPGDWFYICSDGMLEQTEDENIRFVFSDLGGDIDRKRDILFRSTASNRDNRTAILVHITAIEGCDIEKPIENTPNVIYVNPNAAGPRLRNLDSVTEIHQDPPLRETVSSMVPDEVSPRLPRYYKTVLWLLVLVAIFFIAFFFVRSTLS